MLELVVLKSSYIGDCGKIQMNVIFDNITNKTGETFIKLESNYG